MQEVRVCRRWTQGPAVEVESRRSAAVLAEIRRGECAAIEIVVAVVRSSATEIYPRGHCHSSGCLGERPCACAFAIAADVEGTIHLQGTTIDRSRSGAAMRTDDELPASDYVARSESEICGISVAANINQARPGDRPAGHYQCSRIHDCATGVGVGRCEHERAATVLLESVVTSNHAVKGEGAVILGDIDYRRRCGNVEGQRVAGDKQVVRRGAGVGESDVADRATHTQADCLVCRDVHAGKVSK